MKKIILLSAIALATSMASAKPLSMTDGPALGIFYDTQIHSFAPTLTGNVDSFTGSIGISGSNVSSLGTVQGVGFTTYPLTSNSYIVNFIADVGGRMPLTDCLNFAGGLTGSYGATHNSGSSNPYTVGVYVGMNYYASRNFMLTAKILPYDYRKVTSGSTTNEVFSQGSLGMSYAF